jgi:hypothetical protein
MRPFPDKITQFFQSRPILFLIFLAQNYKIFYNYCHKRRASI